MISDEFLLSLRETQDISVTDYLTIARKRYAEGYNLRRQYVTAMVIRPDGTWGVSLRYKRNRKGFMSSKEVIGKSVGSLAFYQGVLDSKLTLVDMRSKEMLAVI